MQGSHKETRGNTLVLGQRWWAIKQTWGDFHLLPTLLKSLFPVSYFPTGIGRYNLLSENVQQAGFCGCNPTIPAPRGFKQRVPGVQSHFLLHREFTASLGYMRLSTGPSLKPQEPTKQTKTKPKPYQNVVTLTHFLLLLKNNPGWVIGRENRLLTQFSI